MPNKCYTNESDLLVRVAWHYYKSDLTQKEIGDKLNISRQKVQRLLQSARENNIVEIRINSYQTSLLGIEKLLKEKYSLTDVVVIPTLNQAANELRGLLGEKISNYLERLLQNEEIKVMGTGWGRVLRECANSFQPGFFRKDMDVTSMVGNLQNSIEVNPYSIATSIARKLSANCYNIWAPALVKDSHRARVFMSEPWIKETIERAKSADLIVADIGPLSKDTLLYKLDYISDKDLKRLEEQGAVGDILSRFFNKQGKLIDKEFHERVIGLPLENLKNAKVMATAYGKDRVPAVRGALSSGLIDVLFIDERVANGLK